MDDPDGPSAAPPPSGAEADELAREEIDLLAEAMIASRWTSSRLSPAELDTLLGLRTG